MITEKEFREIFKNIGELDTDEYSYFCDFIVSNDIVATFASGYISDAVAFWIYLHEQDQNSSDNESMQISLSDPELFEKINKLAIAVKTGREQGLMLLRQLRDGV